MKDRLILGIIGNTGPEADEVLQALIRLECAKRGASKDQDFLPTIVVKNPNIADRTLAIFEGEASPALGVIESSEILLKNGCYFAALPSNTTHYFYEEYQNKTDLYIFDIIKLTIEDIKKSGARKVGLLATTPTVETRIFEDRLAEEGIEVVTPDAETQEKNIQAAIYGTATPGGNHKQRLPDGLKAGNQALGLARVSKAVSKLAAEHGVEVFILGCTEISIISESLGTRHADIRFVDPMKLLATECVDFYTDVKNEIESIKTPITDPKIRITGISREEAIQYVAKKHIHNNIIIFH
ncbi:aspartate racemase [Nitratireductor aquibiodomus RA22]|uniref:Aspartate racemase n=1 Tax=Nitratireductor aquibiodomus RA22 TaxID=1189611 RepID=I5BUH4_9HYPH|nr:amino acid racemase [Nitratireductor aquibiodomus]EIM73226.1 aspartate racemase [Nitratireductor aquibiodomus RA22]